VLEILQPQYDISVLFYNPNIEPYEEYEKRKQEMPKLLEKASLTSIVPILKCGYDNAAFSDAVLSLRELPEGKERCTVCFELRLKETATRAVAGKYDYFATTLTVSPYKDEKVINEIGCKLENQYGVKYLSSNFKLNDGYKRSIELSRSYSLYRQGFCGCETSVSKTNGGKD